MASIEAQALRRDGTQITEEPRRVLGPEVWDKLTPACADTRIIDAAEGRVECVPRRKKVCLMGFASSSREAAPFEDAEYELWGLNQLQPHLGRRADRWFEMHQPEQFTADIVRDTDYVAWLAHAPIPVYMIARYPAVPNAVRFPIERVWEHFECKYLTSTPAMMLALAIMEGFEHIALYGIDLVVGIEYQEQKPCMEFYLGWAMAKGLTIELPKSSALLKSRHTYGYEIPGPPGPVNISTVSQRIEALGERREVTLTRLNQLDGAILEYGHVLVPWLEGLIAAGRLDGTVPEVAKFRERLFLLQGKQEEVHTAVNQLDGAIAELKGSVLHVLDLYSKGVG